MTNQQSTPATKYIAYYRVSTAKQGASGLGLEAQKAEVIRTVGNGIILNEFTDIESGKNNNRVNLEAAISECKKAGATLIIAKLDRLSRDVEFLFKLKNSGIEIKACDLSDFNTLTLGIFATMAQHERELISKRTKDGLRAKKEREPNFKFGNPNGTETMKAVNHLGRAKNLENLASNTNTLDAMNIIVLLRNAGNSFYSIAKELNENPIYSRLKTARTGTKKEKQLDGTIKTVEKDYSFSQVQVKRIFERATK
jgi:hypothetical protein